jgi:hypothetical protein
MSKGNKKESQYHTEAEIYSDRKKGVIINMSMETKKRGNLTRNVTILAFEKN